MGESVIIVGVPCSGDRVKPLPCDSSNMPYEVKKYKGRANLESGLNEHESAGFTVVSINHRFDSVESEELFFVTYHK